jgi:protein gp37
MKYTKIEWADRTWNPITGCLHDCPYCYARRIVCRFGLDFAPRIGDVGFHGCKYDSADGIDTMMELDKPYRKDGRIEPYPMAFHPTFHRYKLDRPQGVTKRQNVFVGSMGEVFGAWVPDKWIADILDACKSAPQHRYLFLTKNPARYRQVFLSPLDYRHNMYFGTTATDGESFGAMAEEVFAYHTNSRNKVFVSIEPLLGEITERNLYKIKYLRWVIIGAETGNRKDRVTPERAWIESIVHRCRAAGTPVFLKNNLAKIWGEPLIREYPWEPRYNN